MFAFATIAEWTYAIIMAVVQGLTEFIPISSSGQLSILNMFFDGDPQAAVDFYFFLHIPTTIAAIVYFRKDIKEFIISWLPKNKETMPAQRRTTVFLIISMFVTGTIGLVAAGHLAEFSSNLLILGIAFLITAGMLVSSEYVLQKSKLHRTMDKLTPARAALIGLVQGLAIVPGISRSGATIAGGLWLGLSRVQATRYSFLLLIPIVIAGSLRDIVRMAQGTLILPSFWISVISFILAGVVGYLTIAGMIKLVQKTSLNWFAVYAVFLGVVLIVLYFV
ncbi:MAG: undecaprenyl-diphosphate phosphatase [Coriobacteriia bacterium]|nr:undecaprenyl-diphosphate phosphatase [Coriobacteriia bacterium]MCL2745965.1 undecaprenyl-diphosphate phosphatase [Coriobacteriia bacterium]MCL2870062.1 undecaprenyl-diphosphate phosphatase [Coriobacteriia bacterium]